MVKRSVGAQTAQALLLTTLLLACGSEPTAPSQSVNMQEAPRPASSTPDPVPVVEDDKNGPVQDADAADPAAEAQHMCAGQGTEFVVSNFAEEVVLLVAHPTTAHRFEVWADSRHGPTGTAERPDEERDRSQSAALCLFEGDFRDVPKGPPPGEDPIEWTRLSVITYEGGATDLYGLGRAETLTADESPPPPPTPERQ